MNQETNLLKAYEAPLVEVIEVEVECGFATSDIEQVQGRNEDLDW